MTQRERFGEFIHNPGMPSWLTDPIAFMKARRETARGQILYIEGATSHGVAAGHLEQSARSGHIRQRFQYDYRWSCLECRKFKEKAEGARLVEAFADHDLWVSIRRESDRKSPYEERKTEGINYVFVPIGNGPGAVLSTGPLGVGCVQVAWASDVIKNVVMPLRWTGQLSSTRGFLPPARQAPYWEAFHKGTRRRCWELHKSPEEARACGVPLQLDGTRRGWYVRGTSQWHQVGRVAVTNWDLVALTDKLRIKHMVDPYGKTSMLELEPMEWEDPRFVRLRKDAGWKPPFDGFQVPPLRIRIRIDVEHAQLSGHA